MVEKILKNLTRKVVNYYLSDRISFDDFMVIMTNITQLYEKVKKEQERKEYNKQLEQEI